MATRNVGSTAFGAAAMKALENHTAPALRLFDDPLAEKLLEGFAAIVLRSAPLRGAFQWMIEGAFPGLFGGMVCRTRAIDDALRAALGEGIEQIVTLGAGLDTRPYRIDELRGARVWELDLPDVQAAKRRAIERVLGASPPHVRYAPIDLATQDLGVILHTAGFDAAAPGFFIWEGVTQYLPAPAVDTTLRFVGATAPGSRIAFTYVPTQVIEGHRHARLVRRLHWQTGLEPRQLAAELRTRGLALRDDIGAHEYAERYLRPRGRVMAVFDLERVAMAVKE
jgi:methyltransferase (TIGR00027 family)